MIKVLHGCILKLSLGVFFNCIECDQGNVDALNAFVTCGAALTCKIMSHHCDPNLFFNAEQQCSDPTFLLHFLRWSNRARNCLPCQRRILSMLVKLCSELMHHRSFNSEANKSRIVNLLQKKLSNISIWSQMSHIACSKQLNGHIYYIQSIQCSSFTGQAIHNLPYFYHSSPLPPTAMWASIYTPIENAGCTS